MLKFIGIGSALNPRLGNNGAYIKSTDGKQMFMIDCGETTYSTLVHKNILDGVEHVHVLVTHFHSDHIGSLGTLIADMHFKEQPFKSRVTVYNPRIKDLSDLLEKMLVEPKFFERRIIDDSGLHRFSTIMMAPDFYVEVVPYRVKHTQEHYDCYGYALNIFNGGSVDSIYYSGDSIEIPDEVLYRFMNYSPDENWMHINTIYQDTSTADYPGNVHLSLKQLTELIPQEHRRRVYCMHLDKSWDVKVATALGFNSVTIHEEVTE